MATITKKGRLLASKLAQSIKVTDSVIETCSLICRHAMTHGNLQEERCNGDLMESIGWEAWDKWTTEKDERLEARITDLVSKLPHGNNGPIVVKFGGDPRGYTVKLVMPDGRYDTWGGAEEGIGVPQ